MDIILTTPYITDETNAVVGGAIIGDAIVGQRYQLDEITFEKNNEESD